MLLFILILHLVHLILKIRSLLVSVTVLVETNKKKLSKLMGIYLNNFEVSEKLQ